MPGEHERKDDVGFFNLYEHDFVRVAVGIPEVHVADPAANAAETVTLLGQAAARGAVLAVFPELGLSAYSNEDLFHQQALLDASLDALRAVVDATASVPVVAVVGAPLVVGGQLYNCAFVVGGGRVHGVVPKTYLPNYREFYELRQFAPGDRAVATSVEVCGQVGVPFGSKLLFRADSQPLLTFHAEICEDLWTPVPPSSFAALAGATVLVNLSASNALVGKDEYRRALAGSQSARCLAAYLYTASGPGESTTDLAWDAHGFVYENGNRLAESERFAHEGQLITADIDLDRLVQERIRMNTFGQSAERHRAEVVAFRTVDVPVALPGGAGGDVALERSYERFPYVPSDPASRDQRCTEVYEIQVHGLVTRLKAMRAQKVVIGVSGGLDSTQALIVCVKAMDVLGLPRANVLAYTMPGFATSARTVSQAHRLIGALGCTGTEIDIRPSCMQMLRDIGHPFADGHPVYDITFENVQAGERTSHLFRLANLHNAPVVGTSDLSELALGWSTYGVGDHMAHYHVNASVPKTLIQYLIRHEAQTGGLGAAAAAVLLDVLDTEISPELVPASSGESGEAPAQRSEDVVGPYELQDFHLYYTLRFGYRPSKVAYLSQRAWGEKYPMAEIKRWLGVFLHRFFVTSQFKRSAIPNAPKVGSGGSLSPRGDWRAPSDGTDAPWIADLGRVPD